MQSPSSSMSGVMLLRICACITCIMQHHLCWTLLMCLQDTALPEISVRSYFSAPSTMAANSGATPLPRCTRGTLPSSYLDMDRTVRCMHWSRTEQKYRMMIGFWQVSLRVMSTSCVACLHAYLVSRHMHRHFMYCLPTRPHCF